MSTNRKPLQKYNPRNLDERDTESLKMGVTEELWEISNNFVQTDEILGDTFEKVISLEIDRDNMNAKIEETYRLSVEGDKVLAEKIDEVSGWIETEGGKLEGLVKEEATVRIEQDEALAQKITTLKAEVEDGDKVLDSQITETNKVVTDLKGTVASNKLELESSINDAKKELTEKDQEVIEQAGKDLADARKALAEAIASGDADAAKKLQAEVDRLLGILNDYKTEVEAKLSVINTTIASGDKALSEQITSATASFNGQIAGVNQTISAQADKLGKVEAKWGVEMNVNGKVSGVSMNNNGSTSAFSVVADKFSISDGSNTTNPPFQVVGGHTRIMSAFINSLQSDNWDGANTGWAITNNGWAHFNNVTVRGTVYANAGSFTGTVNANAGTFNNITINENCTVLGTLYADKIVGLPTGKSFGPLNMDLHSGGNAGWTDVTSFVMDSASGRFNMGGLISINYDAAGRDSGYGYQFPCFRVLVNGAQVAFFYSALPYYKIDNFYPTSASSGKLNGGGSGANVKVEIGVVSVNKTNGDVTFITNHQISPYAKVRNLKIFFYNSIDR